MKKNVVFLTAIFIFLSGIEPGFSQTARDEARRHFDRGMTAVEMAKSPEDYAPAIREFEAAIRLAPKWPGLYYNLGLVQEKAGNLGEAIINLMQYLRLAPRANDAETVKSLVNKLEYRFEQSSNGDTLLNQAVSKGQREVVELLIAQGADINARDSNGSTPLQKALVQGQEEMIGLLIAQGADINIKNQYGFTPLHYAARGGLIKAVELLISEGAAVDPRDGDQLTPLHEAATVGHKEVAEILIVKGADVNAKDISGATPLHDAVIQCQKAMVELLIAKGADINAKNDSGKTPLDLALCQGMADLLKKFGAKR